MSNASAISVDTDLVVVLQDVALLSKEDTLKGLVGHYAKGDFSVILQSADAQEFFNRLLESLSNDINGSSSSKFWKYGRDQGTVASLRAFVVGSTAFNAFLQANVTGPPLSSSSLLFTGDIEYTELSSKRKQFLSSLDIDGLSVYQHIPHVELFCLARVIFTQYFPRVAERQTFDSRWMRIRINAYHQRLLSSGTSNTRLSDSAGSLQLQIDADMLALEQEILKPNSVYSTENKVQFLLEKAQIYIMQGIDIKARENLEMVKTVSKFNYVLSGALGKRTKFQQKDISQLVVFAKSHVAKEAELKSKGSSMGNGLTSDTKASLPDSMQSANGPVTLDLDDDTLLESIKFTKPSVDEVRNSILPAELAELSPDEQPQLEPLDQITLLTEATLKDTLSPLDKLNSEEILPYAVRVLNDEPTNWQIYTQALLVRSRIESHRSRTQERSVLQLQVIVDQIIADTQEEKTSGTSGGIPQIEVTSFIPRAKPSESAPVTERLRFIHQLNTPTRWEIETELAYAWSSAGSLISALEIFKRLMLWPEVALCYHSVGQEDKARQIIRRQLYFSSKGPEMDIFSIDSEETITENWVGEMRSPPPPHAPRMWCILGDLEQDPSCWLRAWEISKGRYARAQRTLGEFYTRTGDLVKAREAYMKATVVNRQNGETWSRLGDIDLRVGNWDGAIVAFQQSIMIEDTDAKTYSNLGSALLSKHDEMVELRRSGTASSQAESKTEKEDLIIDDSESLQQNNEAKEQTRTLTPSILLRQSLTAYKRGASIANTNWQIWDNVITIALKLSPPSYPDILLAFRSIIRIRAPNIGEKAIDIDILRILVSEVVSNERAMEYDGKGAYKPPRGSLAHAVISFVEGEVVPLITERGEIYTLLEKLALYTRSYHQALSYAEKAYRISTTGTAWLEDVQKWKEVVQATENLVSAYENYGEQEVVSDDGTRGVVEKQWKMKARSALRGTMGKAKDVWGDSDECEMLRGRLEELKGS